MSSKTKSKGHTAPANGGKQGEASSTTTLNPPATPPTAAPSNPPADNTAGTEGSGDIATPLPQGMVTSMVNPALPGATIVPPLNIQVVNGQLNLDTMLPEEEREWQEIEQRRKQFGEQVARRRQEAIALANNWFGNLPRLAGCLNPDGTPNMDAFMGLLNQHRAGTLGQPPVVGRRRTVTGTQRTGHFIPDGTRTKIEDELKAGEMSTVLAERHNVSLPTVNKIKKALGLVRPRNRK